MTRKEEPSAELRGILLNLYGAPLQGVELSLNGQETVTADGGEFAFAGVKEGKHTISIFQADHELHTTREVQVSGTGLITLYVQDDDNPITNPGVEFLESNGRPMAWGTYIPSESGQPLGHAEGFKITSDAYTGQNALLIDVDEAKSRMSGRDTIRQSWNYRVRYDGDGWANYGGMHVLTFRYKTEGDPKFRVGIERRRLPGVGDREIHNVYMNFDPAPDWTLAEFEFEWPHPDTHNVEFGVFMQFFTEYGSNGKIWIDDVKLSKLGV